MLIADTNWMLWRHLFSNFHNQHCIFKIIQLIFFIYMFACIRHLSSWRMVEWMTHTWYTLTHIYASGSTASYKHIIDAATRRLDWLFLHQRWWTTSGPQRPCSVWILPRVPLTKSKRLHRNPGLVFVVKGAKFTTQRRTGKVQATLTWLE